MRRNRTIRYEKEPYVKRAAFSRSHPYGGTTMGRKLVVRREALTELTSEEARSVAAGLSGYSCVGVCMTQLEECLTWQWCATIPSDAICHAG